MVKNSLIKITFILTAVFMILLEYALLLLMHKSMPYSFVVLSGSTLSLLVVYYLVNKTRGDHITEKYPYHLKKK